MPLPTLMTAHQGGWDEILLVAGPVAVIAGLLWLADRRARRMGPRMVRTGPTNQVPRNADPIDTSAPSRARFPTRSW